MSLIIAYIVFNIAVSLFFERRKWRIATIAHAVLFTVMLFCMFIFSSDAVVQRLAGSVIGEGMVDDIHTTFFVEDLSETGIFLPLMIIEAVVALTGVFAALLLAKKACEFVLKVRESGKYEVVKGESISFRNPTKERIQDNKLYLRKCLLLC